MKKSIIFLVFLFSINLVSAAYISGDIYLYSNGEARYNLESDSPLEIQNLVYQNNKITGLSSEFLSYNSGTWTFNLNLEKYSQVFIDVHLPRELQSLTSVSSENLIDIDSKTITILNPSQFHVSYKLKNSTGLSWLPWPISLIILILIYLFYKRSRKKKEHLEHIMPLVNENEEKILSTLMKSPKRQKELRKSLNIPKASFTRYLINLEKKKLIAREGEGKNKVVKLR